MSLCFVRTALAERKACEISTGFARLDGQAPPPTLLTPPPRAPTWPTLLLQFLSNPSMCGRKGDDCHIPAQGPYKTVWVGDAEAEAASHSPARHVRVHASVQSMCQPHSSFLPGDGVGQITPLRRSVLQLPCKSEGEKQRK